MKKIISAVLRKGGTGKTTTIMALADGLAIRGQKVLCIDLDSQMNMSMAYGNFHLKQNSIFNVLVDKNFNIYDAIYPVPQEYFSGLEVKGKIDILPANSFVDLLQKELEQKMRKEERLLLALSKLDGNDYDYILIDSGPLPITDIVITNVMVASDEILLPARLEEFSYKGLELVWPRVQMIVEEELNPELKLNGVLYTQVVGRRKISNCEIIKNFETYAKEKGIYIYNSQIRSLEGIVSSQISHQTIYTPRKYNRTATLKDGTIIKKAFTSQTEIAKDYDAFVNEFLEREDK